MPGGNLQHLGRIEAAKGSSRLGAVAETPVSLAASRADNGEAPRLVPTRPSANTVGGCPQNYYDVVAVGDEGEVPRKPLAVFPVEPQMVAGRSRPGCWRTEDRMQQQQEENICGLSVGDGGSGGSDAAVGPSRFVASISKAERTIAVEPVDHSHFCCSASSHGSPRSMVVRIDALHALQGRSGCFDGKNAGSRGGSSGGGGSGGVNDGLYLVLDSSRFTHRTAVRRRHQETCGAGFDGHRTAPRASGGQPNGGGAWDGGGFSSVNDPTTAVDTWVFHETLALPIAAAEGGGKNGGGQGRGAVLPDDDSKSDEKHDGDLLRVRVYTVGGCQPSTGFYSSASPSRCRAPARQHADAAAAAAAGEATAPDDMVGLVVIPLRRHVTVGSGASSGRRSNCTFSRLIKASIVSPDGVAIGWIGLHVCAT